MKLVPNRFRKGKRRVAPRFGVECRPEYQRDGTQWRLHQITLTIRNQADVPHRVDEALIRYDDGRVGLTLPLNIQLRQDIPPHEAVSFNVLASSMLEPGAATKFWVVAFKGKHGQRLEWSSKEEPFTSAAAPATG